MPKTSVRLIMNPDSSFSVQRIDDDSLLVDLGGKIAWSKVGEGAIWKSDSRGHYGRAAGEVRMKFPNKFLIIQ